MHSSNSIIKTVIERIRTFMDEPETDGKYTDDFLVRHVVMPSLCDVWSRLNNGAQNPVVLRYDVAVTAGTSHYAMPPQIGEVWSLSRFDSSGIKLYDWKPSGFWSPCGPGWSLQGNTLSFSPPPTVAETWSIEFVPSADFSMHYATDGSLEAADEFKLSATPALGPLDLRANSYGGAMLRIITSTLVEEHIIESYDVATRVATLRTSSSLTLSADGDPDPIDYTYEVVPQCSQAMADACAACGAVKVSAFRKAAEKDVQQLTIQYRSAMKTLGDRWSNIAMRVGKAWDVDTLDRRQDSTWTQPRAWYR